MCFFFCFFFRPGSASLKQRRVYSGKQDVWSEKDTVLQLHRPHTHTHPTLPLGLTYGGNEGGVEGIVRETKKDAGLAHSRVPDQEQLEKQVVRLLRHWEERLGRSPRAAPGDRSLSPGPTPPRPGVFFRPEDRGGVGTRRVREGAGDLRTASSRKHRRRRRWWRRRSVLPRAATAAPQPLPAALLCPVPGSRPGQNGLPSPPQGCSAGTAPTGEPASSAVVQGARGAWKTVSLPSRTSALGLGDGSQRRTPSRELKLHSHRKPSRPGQSHLSPVPSHAGVRARCLTHART